MPQGIFIREFARRDGCSETLVRKGVKAGRLLAFPDGSVDPNAVGTGWRAANRGAANSAPAHRVRVNPGETPEQAAERIVAVGAELLSVADAERLKENYLGRLRQLEYDVKSGAVVPAEEVAREVGAAFAAVRTRLLAIPAEQAPRIHRCKTVAEVQAILMDVVHEALEGLTRDTGAAEG